MPDLEIVEFPSPSVQPGLDLRRPKGAALFPHALQTSKLRFNWRRFYWAMAQTAIRRARVPTWEVGLEAGALAMRYFRHFHTSGAFGLRDGRATYYVDADQAHFSSRVGEAVGYLVSKEILNYHSVDRLEGYCKAHGIHVGRGRKPDYVMSTGINVALADFKCRSKASGMSPPFHQNIEDGIHQCSAFKTRTKFQTNHDYAIVTILRERCPGEEESFVAVADPEGAPVPPDPRTRASELFMRDVGFTACLAGAGDVGNRLLGRPRRGPEGERVGLVRVENLDFYVDPRQTGSRTEEPALFLNFAALVPVIGIRKDTLDRAVQLMDAATPPAAEELRAATESTSTAGYEIMRDGTLVADSGWSGLRGLQLVSSP